jgi:hypothetical protein
MKNKLLFNPQNLFRVATIAVLLLLNLKLNAQFQVIVPNDIVPSDLVNATNPGWRLLSTGNSTSNIVNNSNFGIPSSFGPHSIRANRAGGAGNNRSFLGYFEGVRTLASLVSFTWNRYSEQGTDRFKCMVNLYI